MNDYYIQSEFDNLGAKFNENFIGCIGYCDDNINISSIPYELQQMINNYFTYCYNWGIQINNEKCYFVSFGYHGDSNAKFFINNKEIKKKNQLNYLGYTFNYNVDENLSFYNNFNSVRNSFYSLSTFGLNPHGFNHFLQAHIFKTFCISNCFAI